MRQFPLSRWFTPATKQTAKRARRVRQQSRQRFRPRLEEFETRVVPTGDLLTAGFFQLDGNALTSVGNPLPPGGLHDFDQVYDPGTYGSPGGQAPIFLADGLANNNGGGTGGALLDTTLFTGGATKDTNDISSWQWAASGNLQDKSDIENAYAVAYVNPVDNHLLIYFGLDRHGISGAASVSFWFLQNAISLNPNGTFNGVHANGDLLFQADVDSNSTNMHLAQWQNGALVTIYDNNNGTPEPPPPSDTVQIVANTAPTPAPWPFRFGSGSPPPLVSDFPAFTFFEGGFDATEALGGEVCNNFLTYIAETRASASDTASLSDFAMGTFDVSNCPDLMATKTNNVGGATAPGTPWTWTIQVANQSTTGYAIFNAAEQIVLDNLPNVNINYGTVSVQNLNGISGTGTISASITSNNLTATANGGTVSIAPGGSFDLVFTATATDVGTYVNPRSGGLANVDPNDLVDEDFENNNSYTDTVIVSPLSDLSLTKTANNNTPLVGSNVTFTITVSNSGPSNTTGVTVGDLLPNGLQYVSDTGGGSYNSGTGTWTIGALTSGGTATLQITALVLATGTYTNYAQVLTSGLNDPDSTPGNGSTTEDDDDTVILTPIPVADLSITKTDGQTSDTPGTSITYTIVVTNNGPSAVTGANVVDNLPATLSGISWTASYANGSGPANGAGNINVLVNLLAGGTATFTVNALIDPAATGTLSNTASVTPPGGTTDSTPGNNSATDTTTLLPVGDLSLTKTANNNTPLVGSTVTFTITVSNSGPSNTTGVTVGDLLPSGLQYVSDTGGGSYNSGTGTWTIGTLTSGGTATLQITALVRPTGNYANYAQVVTSNAADPDSTPGNGSTTEDDDDTVILTPIPVADLSITKTDGSSTYTPGAPITYTIVVTNNGPSFVANATVTDTLPANLIGATWTASYTGLGSSGPASGAGHINALINLAASGTATFLVTGTMVSTATGNLVNSASVTAPGGTSDPNPGNNSATDTDTAAPMADLSITKTDGSAEYFPGGTTTYTIVVTNTGPSFVTGATVTDTLPAPITSATWTVSYTGVGSSGPASGAGNINANVNLAAGGTAVFTLVASISPTASGNLVNTATVAPPAGTTDANNGNNSATDTDTPANLPPSAPGIFTVDPASSGLLATTADTYIARSCGELIFIVAGVTDPDPGDNAAGFTYQFDWNSDGVVDVSSAPGQSGVLFSYPTEFDQGDYTPRVRAVDQHGAASDWGDLDLPNVKVLAAALYTDENGIINLTINGTMSSDAISVSAYDYRNVLVHRNGVEYGPFTLSPNGHIIISTCDAPDIIQVSGYVSYEIHGGAGNDTIYGGSGQDVIYGDEGNDFITAGIGNDVVLGGLGKDSIQGGNGADIMVGGAVDKLAYDYATLRVISDAWFANPATSPPPASVVALRNNTIDPNTASENDKLWGALDKDVFIYRASGAGLDTLMDYKVLEKDALLALLQ